MYTHTHIYTHTNLWEYLKKSFLNKVPLGDTLSEETQIQAVTLCELLSHFRPTSCFALFQVKGRCEGTSDCWPSLVFVLKENLSCQTFCLKPHLYYIVVKSKWLNFLDSCNLVVCTNCKWCCKRMLNAQSQKV